MKKKQTLFPPRRWKKVNIKDLSFEELNEVLIGWREETYRTEQIFSWIYKKGALDFEAMSDVSFELRQRLEDNFYFSKLSLSEKRESSDGTIKFLFELEDGNLIESVFIPTPTRRTICISTQVGCKFGCRFCASGLAGYVRDLSCAEIVEQVLFLKNHIPEKKLFSFAKVMETPLLLRRNYSDGEYSCEAKPIVPLVLRSRITHIVIMGVGEPLDNYDNTLKAVRLFNSPYGFNIGARRITISTCGIIPGIRRLSKEKLQIELSISLHAADNQTREKIMPVNKKYPLEDLIAVAREYVDRTNRAITFEYILIKGMNDSLKDTHNLARLLKGMNCKVNLIPLNPVKEFNLRAPTQWAIRFFKKNLDEEGITATVRMPRGRDIEAACGQLRSLISAPRRCGIAPTRCERVGF